MQIQNIDQADRQIIGQLVRELWGDELILVHGESYHTASLHGLKAVRKAGIVGFLHYQVAEGDCEILTLAAVHKKQGIGTALVNAIELVARSNGCLKLKVTTTNDNLGALVFYQRCGFLLSGVGLGLVDEARKQKSSIPIIGDHNIPIHDEIYFEKDITGS
jgi:GNAT superfamily N-acetyltransferase